MRILIIESATEKGAVVLSQGGQPIAFKFLPGGPALSRCLAFEVAQILEKHHFRPERVAIGLGPGSFTGIRVGAALGLSLAYGWEVPTTGVGSLQGFAPPVSGSFAIFADARSAGFYTLLGRREEDNIFFEVPQLLRVEQAQEVVQAVQSLASPHPKLIQNRLKGGENWFETSPNPSLLAQLVSENPNAPVELIY